MRSKAETCKLTPETERNREISLREKAEKRNCLKLYCVKSSFIVVAFVFLSMLARTTR